MRLLILAVKLAGNAKDAAVMIHQTNSVAGQLPCELLFEKVAKLRFFFERQKFY